MENFLPLAEAPEKYLVGDAGTILGLVNSQGNARKQPVALKPHKCKSGYLHVSLRTKPGELPKRVAVHRLVCETFNGKRPSMEFECAHSNGIKEINTAENLRWVTRKENAADRNLHCRTVWGEMATRGKLSSTQVQEVRQMLKDGMSQAKISRAFNVSPQAINKIVKGESWARLPG